MSACPVPTTPQPGGWPDTDDELPEPCAYCHRADCDDDCAEAHRPHVARTIKWVDGQPVSLAEWDSAVAHILRVAEIETISPVNQSAEL